MPDVNSWLLVHTPIATIKTRCSRVHLSGRTSENRAQAMRYATEISPAIGVDGLAVDVALDRAWSETPEAG